MDVFYQEINTVNQRYYNPTQNIWNNKIKHHFLMLPYEITYVLKSTLLFSSLTMNKAFANREISVQKEIFTKNTTSNPIWKLYNVNMWPTPTIPNITYTKFFNLNLSHNSVVLYLYQRFEKGFEVGQYENNKMWKNWVLKGAGTK